MAPQRLVPVILTCDASQSEQNLDHEAGARATIAMHPVTGAFVDPTHESAFAVQLFRSAFPVHILLLAILLMTTFISTLTDSAHMVKATLVVLCGSISLVGRVLIHRMHDSVRAQRMGSWTWAVLVTVLCIDMMTLPVVCEKFPQDELIAAMIMSIALLNGTHGMAFAQKTGLIGLCTVTDFAALTMCEAPLIWYLCDLGGYVVSATVTQMAELYLRHSYAENHCLAEDKLRLEERTEQLQAEKERLLYDVQRSGRLLDDGDDRSAIRRGLQVEPSQPYYPVDGTDSSETGAPAPSDSPLASLPPGPPSSVGKSSISGRSGRSGRSGKSSRASKSTALPPTCSKPTAPPRPPPTWAELDAQHYAELAAASATEQGMATQDLVQLSRQVHGAPPPTTCTWAELDAQHYACMAATSAIEKWAVQELVAAQALADIAER